MEGIVYFLIKLWNYESITVDQPRSKLAINPLNFQLGEPIEQQMSLETLQVP